MSLFRWKLFWAVCTTKPTESHPSFGGVSVPRWLRSVVLTSLRPEGSSPANLGQPSMGSTNGLLLGATHIIVLGIKRSNLVYWKLFRYNFCKREPSLVFNPSRRVQTSSRTASVLLVVQPAGVVFGISWFACFTKHLLSFIHTRLPASRASIQIARHAATCSQSRASSPDIYIIAIHVRPTHLET